MSSITITTGRNESTATVDQFFESLWDNIFSLYENAEKTDKPKEMIHLCAKYRKDKTKVPKVQTIMKFSKHFGCKFSFNAALPVKEVA